MDDKCPFCGAGIRENLHTLKTFTCNTKHSLFSEEWVYWQSVECKDHQIADLQEKLEKTEGLWQYWQTRCLQAEASRDRWKELFEAYSEYGMGTYFTSDGEAEVKKAVAALKSAGEWED